MTQKTNITFKEFLETGELNGITVESSMEDVLSKWGEPEAKTVPSPKRGKDRDRFVGWKYGDIEIGFDANRIFTLGFNAFQQNLPEWLNIEGYLPDHKTTEAKFLEYLDGEDIAYRVYDSFDHGQDHPPIILESGAVIGFDTNGTVGEVYFDSLNYNINVPKIIITFKDFLETGRLKGVEVGISKDIVSRSWGEPESKTEPYPKRGKDKGYVVGWQYGVVEVGFAGKQVNYFGFDFHYDELPDWLQIEGYIPNSNTTVDEFLAYLNRENIAYKDYPPLTRPDHIALLLGAGATVVFSDKQMIDSIYFSESSLNYQP